MVLLGTVASAAAIFSLAYLNHLKYLFHRGIYWFSFFTSVLGIANLLLASNAVAFIVFWENHVSQLRRGGHRSRLSPRSQRCLDLSGRHEDFHFTPCDRLCLDARPDWQLDLFRLVRDRTRGDCSSDCHIFLPLHKGWYLAVSSVASLRSSRGTIAGIGLMSGVMVKTAIYAMIRILGFSAAPVVAVAYIAIALGSVSSFWGILFALMERDLKRLLAYSTVENVGADRSCPGHNASGKISRFDAGRINSDRRLLAPLHQSLLLQSLAFPLRGLC